MYEMSRSLLALLTIKEWSNTLLNNQFF